MYYNKTHIVINPLKILPSFLPIYPYPFVLATFCSEVLEVLFRESVFTRYDKKE